MSIRSRVLNRLFGLLYGPLVFLHEPAGTCLFGPSWAGRRDGAGRSLPADGLALDVGCGSGILLSRLPDRAGNPVGIDPSRAMARRARDRGCHVVQASAAAVPLADSSVFGIVCSYPGPWIRDSDVWEELVRVTVPGAPVTILLGGTVIHGRFSMIRSKLIPLLYGTYPGRQQDIAVEGFGHARVPGQLCKVNDKWGQAILWQGIRGDDP